MALPGFTSTGLGLRVEFNEPTEAAASGVAAGITEAGLSESQRQNRSANSAPAKVLREVPGPPRRKTSMFGGSTLRKDVTSAVADASEAPTGDSTEEVTDAVVTALREVIASQRRRVIDMFMEWDEDGDGTISKFEFRGALVILGITASAPVSSALFDSFDEDKSGTINYNELAAALSQTQNTAVQLSRGSRPDAAVDAAADLASNSPRSITRKREKLNHGKAMFSRGLGEPSADQPMHMRLRRGLASNWVRLVDLFRVWDVDGDGGICKAEFGEALCTLDLIAEPHEADDFFKAFDLDGSGQISLCELEYLLKQRPPEPPNYSVSPRQRMLRPPPESPRRPLKVEKVYTARAAKSQPTQAAVSGTMASELPKLSPRARPLPAVSDVEWFRRALKTDSLPPSPRGMVATLPVLRA